MNAAPHATPSAPSVEDGQAAPTRRELRAFALLVGGALLALAAVGSWRHRLPIAAACGALGLALGAVGAIAPGRLGGAYRAWMRLALAMSRVTTPVLMAVVYFGVLTPVALLMRLAGRRALGVPRAAASGWVDRAPGARQSDLRRQF